MTLFTEEKKKFFEEEVGEIAGLVMFGSVVFILFQVFVWIGLAVPMIFLPLLVNLSPSALNWITYSTLLVLEAIAAYFTAKLVFKSIQETLKARPSAPSTREPKAILNFTLNETSLEVMMAVAALGAILYYLVMNQFQSGPPVTRMGVSVIHRTFEIFGFIFMTIFILVRLWLTGRVRIIPLISLTVVGYSLWAALIKPHF